MSVAMAGNALRRAYEAGKAHAPKLMVSAFAAEMRITLSCLAAKDGDEVAAALELLGRVDLAGKIVTAMHCTAIATSPMASSPAAAITVAP
ncbi:hypothetical protein [Rhodoplanes sp. SY1]|uniref:hypothetical protein n=1 Tax=Rhodoplanes sp. SY1 TaxID=3166646 RepID=UPI0038B4E6D5